ncbi:hypothetical protein MYP_2768 [Sporocytophaga myxococcoides]|uniref:Uncharacterized protein n=1 Tax=Sporocytophaga myxococcoides TaxID=153721 RepID=A0A098LGF3_9BACT|nr:hypothetical protein MYP_2768 [Sporocytophaga myxococcoides]
MSCLLTLGDKSEVQKNTPIRFITRVHLFIEKKISVLGDSCIVHCTYIIKIKNYVRNINFKGLSGKAGAFYGTL